MARANKPSIRREVQTGRAKWAWEAVAAVADGDGVYLTEARKLPARLLTSGLGQTTAYLHAKGAKSNGGSGIALLYRQLSERLRTLEDHKDPNISAMEIIVNLEPRRYRVLGREMLVTAEWIKRFAEGRNGGET